MKKSLLVLLLLTAVLLSACRQQPVSQVYTVEQNGIVFTVDKSQGTITQDDHVYHISVSGGYNSVTTTVTYPDGSTYYYTQMQNGGHGGWSEDYDPDRYLPGDVLLAAWDHARPAVRQRNGNPLLGFLCLLIGALNLAFPQLAWFFRHGWAYRDAEPSNLALGLTRMGGGILLVIGVILIVV